jgi:hypothetical protein
MVIWTRHDSLKANEVKMKGVTTFSLLPLRLGKLSSSPEVCEKNLLKCVAYYCLIEHSFAYYCGGALFFIEVMVRKLSPVFHNTYGLGKPVKFRWSDGQSSSHRCTKKQVPTLFCMCHNTSKYKTISWTPSLHSQSIRLALLARILSDTLEYEYFLIVIVLRLWFSILNYFCCCWMRSHSPFMRDSKLLPVSNYL